jgi:hypothetical protein
MISTFDGGEHSKGIGTQAVAPGNPVRTKRKQRGKRRLNSRLYVEALPVPHRLSPGALTVRAVALSIDVATFYGQDH